jgi:hypothetical protein
MDSQASVSSSTSTVPLDLIHDQDNDFVDEIDEVDRIYFGNIEINLRDDISYSDLKTNMVYIFSEKHCKLF